MAALPEKEQPTAVNDRAGYIFPSSQFEQADLKAKVVDPLKMEAPLKRSLRRALKKCGYKEQDYNMLPDALRLRVSVITEELCKDKKLRTPDGVLAMAKGWIMEEAAQGSRGKQQGLFKQLFKLVRRGKAGQPVEFLAAAQSDTSSSFEREAAPMVTVDVYAPSERMSLFRAAAEKLPGVHNKEDQLVTDGFLDVCSLVVPVIEQFGGAFGLVKNDINQNIERLRTRKAQDPQQFEVLFNIIDEEVSRNDHNHSKSCTKGLLWLKRALEFMMAIMRRLLQKPEMSMSEVVYEQYHATLAQWHGFWASSAFNVAFNFVPSRQAFMEKVAGTDDPDALKDMQAFIDNFSPVLAEAHKFLDERGLDDPAKV